MLHFLRHIGTIAIICFALSAVGQSSNPVGNAYADGDDCYVVTTDVLWQLGAVWFNDPLNFSEPFEISLSVFLGANDGGADGLAMVFQQVGTDAIGLSGGGLGFEGFSPSLGIELDTYQNIDLGDPVYDHMAILANGNVNHNGALNLAGPTQISGQSANVEDGQDHLLQAVWDPVTQVLDVYFDCELRLSYNEDVVETLFSGDPIVFWGFTGSTGGLSNLQSVCISEFALGLQDEYAVCAGESVQLGVSGGTDGSYSWEPSEFVDDPSSATPWVNPPESTLFTVTYTDVCGDETSLETMVEVVQVEVSLPDLAGGCDGETVELEVMGNADSYVWSTDEEGEVISVMEAGSISVTGTLGDCEASDEVDVQFYNLPEFINLPITLNGCEGDVFTIDGSAADAETYSWSSGEDEAQINVEVSGEYTVTAVSSFGCSASAFAEVTVTAYPEAGLPDQIEICEGQSTILVAGDADSWLWNTGATTQSIEIDDNGIYSVTLETNDCISEGQTDLILLPLPDFEWTATVEFCVGNSVWLTIPDQPYNWMWEGAQVSDSVEINSAGYWQMAAVDPSSGCTTVDYTQATVLPLPLLEAPAFGTICDGRPALIELETDFPDQVLWDDGSTNLENEFIVPGYYWVSATNECGTTERGIEIDAQLCSCPLYIPNAFTPDLDGLNEVFVPSFDCDPEFYRFAIYNRWGELLFETFEPNEGWNGSGAARSHWVPEDVYVWQITYQVDLFEGPELVNRSGSVMVIR